MDIEFLNLLSLPLERDQSRKARNGMDETFQDVIHTYMKMT
jgi:hypothetical protein